MDLSFHQVDAFADQIFQGNPAAVFILDAWLPDTIMQAIAAEMQLPETAFAVQRDDGDYRIRWFTPSKEVALCGHATLATTHVLYEHYAHPKDNDIRFHSQSGILSTARNNYGLCMNFPTQAAIPSDHTQAIENALHLTPRALYENDDLIVLLDDASEVAIFEPELKALSALPYRGVCISAPDHSGTYDFVCRFFAPACFRRWLAHVVLPRS